MPFAKINFAEVEEFEPLPEGEYGVEIEKVEVRMNKAGDGQYLNWELVVIDGDYENRRLWMITSLKPQALFRLKQVLEALEVLDDEEEMELEYDDDVEPSTSAGPQLLDPDLVGLEATAVIKNEMYDGRERNRVDSLYGEGRKAKKPKAKAKRSSNGGSERSSRSSGGSRRRLR